MGSLFSKKTSRITEQDAAILKLKKARDQLKIQQKRINTVLAKDREVAKRLLREGKKDRALLLLRKKRYQEDLITKAEGQINNIEQLVQDLEFVQIETQVIDGLKAGNEALSKANEMFSLDEIECLMDETKESIDKQKEIETLISGQLTEEDEEDALEELNTLLFQEEEEKQAAKDKEEEESEKELPELPNVPEEPLPKKKASTGERVALEAA
uniref:Charged multivesicular body protein 6-A n=1 Tax=Caligus rogercresseyi TaxID=217165 RepID=C1BR44_CALRO|nr:Charged multivesicular body protein 6-A [Caligus rogercresseyi]|eukprot:TRINITY_DN4286_c0_g1_i1.p1 TRINITY_DN4286_c0_g1~~TRINITY_DN4286_c0_g1_i1.p1  ORF type:complete len:213 (+),score=71.54 TRINITY_DN4286_c0_g1_i1:87-725(+)